MYYVYVGLLKTGGEKREVFPASSFGGLLPVSQGPVSQRGELWLTKTAEKTKPKICNQKASLDNKKLICNPKSIFRY